MGGRDELVKALEAIVRTARSESGEPPTADELLAYRDGGLDAGERERIAAKLERFPEAAQALENLEAFPQVPPVAGVADPTSAETDAAWQSFRRRMGYDEGPVPPASGREEQGVGPVARSPRHWSVPWWTRPRLAWGFAVGFLALGLVLGWAAGRSHPPPTSNLVVAQLAPERAVRPRAGSAVARIRVPKGADGLVLVLGAAGDAAGVGGPVRVERADGKLVWRSATVEVDSTGTGWMQLPVEYLSSGEYRVVVGKEDAGDGSAVVTYQFRVESESVP